MTVFSRRPLLRQLSRRAAKRRWLWALLAMAPFTAGAAPATENDATAERLRETEVAFAQTMADRDFEAFQSFLAEDTVFFAGATVDRGKAAVAARWAAYFEGPEAPFSWAPEQAAVLDSGELGLSSGPVLDATGQRVATFNSVWRLEDNGQWRIVFDKGERWCPPPEAPD